MNSLRSCLRCAVLVLMLMLVVCPTTLIAGQDPIASSLRGNIVLNGAWQTNPSTAPSPIPTSGWTSARVPAWAIEDGTVALWYQDSIYMAASWLGGGRRWFLNFDQVGHYAAVYMNGQLVGTNYGQFAPFSVEVTSALVAGNNTLNVYVHDSDATYAYSGANLNQSSCAGLGLPSNCQALSYRSASNDPVSRNWIGITGDVTLSWRPAAYVQSVVTLPSVRNSTLSATVLVNGSGSYTVQSRVLDGSTVVLSLPPMAVQGGVAGTLTPTSWSNPVLWGPPGYGQPKLYTLQTQLLQGSALLDTEYDTFGFREVWVNGLSVELNGVPLHAVGNYNFKLSDLRETNDRRPLAAELTIFEASGLNMWTEHWDTNPIGYQLADEMGLLAEGSFFCNGPYAQAAADSQSAWTNFMSNAASAWTQKYANHPSIVIWRPFDVLPEELDKTTVVPTLGAILAANDPQGRPIADGGQLAASIDFWAQDVAGTQAGTCADLTPLENQLAAQTRPLFVKELYGGQGLSCASGLFQQVDGFLSTYPAMAGMVIQQLSFNTSTNFTLSWLSQSGIGNRPVSQPQMNNGMMPDWNGTWTPTKWSTLFAGLDPWPITLTAPSSGDFEATAPAGATLGVLTASDGYSSPSVVAADGGSVWWVVPWTGSGVATYYNGSGHILTRQTVNVQSPPVY